MKFDHGQLISSKSSTPSVVSNANGTQSPMVGEGSLSFSTSLHLDSVLLVPSLDHNLLYVAQLTTILGCTITFWPNHCVFQDILTGKMIISGTRRGNLHRVPFPLSSNKSLIPLSLVHFDVWGPAKIAIPAGAQWLFIKWWRLNFMPEFRFFVLTMAENFSTMILTSSYKIMASYINTHALTLSNRMGWLKERTDTYWKSFVPLSLVPICHDPFGAKSSSLQHTLSIGFPLLFTYREPVQNDRLLADNDQLPKGNFQLSPCCQNQEKEIEPVYESLPASGPVPHQSPAEEVIHVTSFLETDNTNEISHDDLISEGTKPTYQLPERKNCGKPRVQYEANLKAKGKNHINNYISVSRLLESRRDEGKLTALIVHIDDIIVSRNDAKELLKLQKYLSWEFEMKDLGDLKYFLGIKVASDVVEIFQRFYQMIQTQFMLPIKVFRSDNGEEFVNSVLSHFFHTKGVLHETTCPQTPQQNGVAKCLLFKKNGYLDLEGYTDADYARNITDRRSTSGYFTFVGGNLVTWRSKKQNVVSRSSAESEYRGIAQGVCEILGLRWLLAEIMFRPNVATKLHCDNQFAFQIANNPVQHDRTKHVEVDRHFIKEKLEHKLISIPFVPSSKQLANMLTHAVSKHQFEDSLDKLGITDIYAPT
ncbi:unnamed protein product [Prunus brigantina]